MVSFAKKWLCSGKVVVFEQKWLYSGKLVEFEQKWLYSRKVVVFGHNGFIRAMWRCSDKVGLFG